MILIAKGRLHLNGAHMHRNFRLEEQNLFSLQGGFLPSSVRMFSSFRQACGTNRLISKEKGTFKFIYLFLMKLHYLLHLGPESRF